jgi:hypothetical protein
MKKTNKITDYHMHMTAEDVKSYTDREDFYSWKKFQNDMLIETGWVVPSDPTYDDYFRYQCTAWSLIADGKYNFAWGNIFTKTPYTEYQTFLRFRSIIRMESGLRPLDHDLERKIFIESWK